MQRRCKRPEAGFQRNPRGKSIGKAIGKWWFHAGFMGFYGILGDFMVLSWWFHGILWDFRGFKGGFMVVSWWFHGILGDSKVV